MPRARAKGKSRGKASRFYETAVTKAAELIEANEIDGVDEELAVLRVRLRSLLEERPQDFALMLRGIEIIVRAVNARHRMSPERREEMVDHLRGVLDSLGRQLFPEPCADA